MLSFLSTFKIARHYSEITEDVVVRFLPGVWTSPVLAAIKTQLTLCLSDNNKD